MRKNKGLQEVMPIYRVEQDAILSRRGDVTVAYQLLLPEIFTLGINDYEALHQAWLKAIRLLPVHTILQKKDYFLESRYKADFTKEDQTFLARSSERFFNERPYLDHTAYLYLTQKPADKRQATALYSSLSRPSVGAVQTIDPKLKDQFLDKCGQFAQVLQDAGYIQLRRLTDDELASTPEQPGLLERYCYLLHPQETPVIRDITLTPGLQVGDQHCQIFSLADTEEMPALCGPRINYDKYSTDKSKFSIGFAAPLGQMLNCNHIYNQYILIEDAAATIKKMEGKRLRLQSLSAYSRQNSLSKESINNFLNEAISLQRLPVKAHFNLLVWSSDPAKAADLRNNVSAALSQIDARAKQETTCAAHLFWAGMPGNAADLPIHETFDTFAEQASCFFNQESNYRSSISPVGFRFAERLHGFPIHVDISDLPVKLGICTNRNKFILGPSGPDRAIFN